jgi:hypothetical protein
VAFFRSPFDGLGWSEKPVFRGEWKAILKYFQKFKQAS